MKSTRVVITEATLYVIIAAGSPFAEFLISDRVITTRSLIGVSVVALVAGANALKAFLSQSMRSEEPLEARIINPPSDPVNTEEAKRSDKKKP